MRKALGSGGMGVVYHAYDRQKGIDVALKTLRFVDADAIYRLKREFRSLANVSHPNLVTLYELISEGSTWFITMELVRGMTFLDYVSATPPMRVHEDTVDVSSDTHARSVRIRSPLDDPTEEERTEDKDEEDLTEAEPRGPRGGTESTDVSQTLRLGKELLALHSATSSISGPTLSFSPKSRSSLDTMRDLDLGGANTHRLRAALRQVAQGLFALHAMGKIHRDIKPSNVLVTPSGRVVILDFGLVTELLPEDGPSITEQGFSGTIPYMAPEIGSPDSRAPAADWYGVGVMLFEALAGRLPFIGHGIDVLLRKQREDAPRIETIVTGAPADLVDLTNRLLSRDPRQRPTGEEVVRVLGGPSRSVSITGASRNDIARQGPFIGRQRHLDALEVALGAVDHGHPVSVFVRGASGIGKTSLVRSFLDEVRSRENVLVLSGRCYERESVPFKALDSLIDALSRHLSKLRLEEITPILPRTIRALARIFPVLSRVEAIERAPRLPAETPDQQELRRRAFRALSELLGRLSEQGRIVLFIDDLQWGDADSAAMLLDLLKPPEAPPIMLIGCYRAEEEAQSTVIRDMVQKSRAEGGDVRVLTVGALSPEEARDLAYTLLHQSEIASPERAEQIAEESQGNPFFIDALVRHQKREPRPTSSSSGRISLDRVMQNRLSRLSRPSRRALELIAVAGRPLHVDLIVRAAALGVEDGAQVLSTLKAANLVRTQSGSGGELVETFHDRIRDAVLAQLTPEQQREQHRTLAQALERFGSANEEAIFYHYREAGEQAQAARYAAAAGEGALISLAFDRAARLFQVAIGSLERGPERRRLTVLLGNALASAGRGAEAAKAYLTAAQDATDLEAVNLHRLAAEQYLLSGRIDEGLEILREVLKAADLKLAKTPRRAYLSRVMRRNQLWRRGFEFTETDESDIDPEALMRIDILWSAVSGLMMVDFIRGADFQTRHTLEALEAGEPYRLARAFALETWYVGSGGGRGQWRTAKLIEETHSIAARADHPHALGLAAFAEGAAAYFEGHWSRARVLLERAEEIFRDRCAGVTWEIMAARTLLFAALQHMGQIAIMAKRIPAIVDEAELRGDLFAGTLFRAWHATAVWMAADNPERALRNIEEAIGKFSKQSYYVQHCMALLGRSQIYLYGARAEHALQVLEEEWPKLEDHYFLKLQNVRIEAIYLRALALIGTAHQNPRRRNGLLSQAERWATELEKESMRWSTPLAAMIRAGVQDHRGDAAQAAEQLKIAIDGFVGAGMPIREAAARIRLGETWGGDRGRALVQDGLSKMFEQGIKNPLRFCLSLAPIFSKYS
ncbi:MAG: protein kinase [Myxococcota bacterium]